MSTRKRLLRIDTDTLDKYVSKCKIKTYKKSWVEKHVDSWIQCPKINHFRKLPVNWKYMWCSPMIVFCHMESFWKLYLYLCVLIVSQKSIFAVTFKNLHISLPNFQGSWKINIGSSCQKNPHNKANKSRMVELEYVVTFTSQCSYLR